MANFDETLVEYWETRQKLRELQGELQKKKNAAAVLNKEIEQLVKKYNNCRSSLVEVQSKLVPILHAEVASHPVLEQEAAEKGKRVVEKLVPPPEEKPLISGTPDVEISPPGNTVGVFDPERGRVGQVPVSEVQPKTAESEAQADADEIKSLPNSPAVK